MTKNNKGQGLPIGTLVLIALAVFVLFLIIGFVTSGWSFFSGKFGLIKEGTSGYDEAANKCQTWCSQWVSTGKPGTDENGYLISGSTWYARLCSSHSDIDLDGDGTEDTYSCRRGTDPILPLSDSCPVVCETGSGGGSGIQD